ncbi:MAG: hypothetical protein QOJ75_676 [Chloroflexota bacterium]|nr:hypothetical protein [Chloroflexota bacterium]
MANRGSRSCPNGTSDGASTLARCSGRANRGGFGVGIGLTSPWVAVPPFWGSGRARPPDGSFAPREPRPRSGRTCLRGQVRPIDALNQPRLARQGRLGTLKESSTHSLTEPAQPRIGHTCPPVQVVPLWGRATDAAGARGPRRSGRPGPVAARRPPTARRRPARPAARSRAQPPIASSSAPATISADAPIRRPTSARSAASPILTEPQAAATTVADSRSGATPDRGATLRAPRMQR